MVDSVQAVFVTKSNTKIGTVPLDVAISQRHLFPTKITDNPVEDGTVYADHVVLLPTVLEIDGRVTDASVSLVDTFTGKFGVQDAYRELIRMQRAKEPFDVVTGLNVYQNMLLQELDIVRSPLDGRSLRFTATLREILIVGKDVPTNRDLVAQDVRHTALPIANNGLVSKVLA